MTCCDNYVVHARSPDNIIHESENMAYFRQFFPLRGEKPCVDLKNPRFLESKLYFYALDSYFWIPALLVFIREYTGFIVTRCYFYECLPGRQSQILRELNFAGFGKQPSLQNCVTPFILTLGATNLVVLFTLKG
uniref:Uncharacterized protein n=1 Tax=Glossina pallidipes TaxID=7398 RepID=A0A1B0AGL9_GLOPL